MNAPMRPILVLGARGNLGTQLVRTFGELGVVLAWDIEEVDITNGPLVRNRLLEVRPEVIVNAAAYNAVDKCEEPEAYALARRINTEAVGTLAQAALDLGAILVHFSTDYVFGDDSKPSGYTEQDPPSLPISKYAETKLEGEREVTHRALRGLKWYLVRTSKLFGPRGASPMAKPSFFDVMLKLGEEREQLDLVDEEMSCFTYTPDLARAVKALVESGRPWGVYHIVNEGPATWYDGARELFDIVGNRRVRLNRVTADKLPRPARRAKSSILLNTRLPKLRDWREALREYLQSRG